MEMEELKDSIMEAQEDDEVVSTPPLPAEMFEKIFETLSEKDLFAARHVSRSWDVQATTVIRTLRNKRNANGLSSYFEYRFNGKITINLLQHSSKIRAVFDQLQRINLSPNVDLFFDTLCINGYGFEYMTKLRNPEYHWVLPEYGNYLKKLHIVHVRSISISDLQDILNKFCPNLEELQIILLSDSSCSVDLDEAKNLEIKRPTNLRRLQLLTENSIENDNKPTLMKFYKNIVRASPALTCLAASDKLIYEISPSAAQNLEYLKVFRSYSYFDKFPNLDPQNFRKLKHLECYADISYPNVHVQYVGQMRRSVLYFLNRLHLSSLSLSGSGLVDIPVQQQLKVLKCDDGKVALDAVLRNMPNLEVLSVQNLDVTTFDFEDSGAPGSSLQSNNKLKCIKLTKMELDSDATNVVKMIAKMFPNVKKFSAKLLAKDPYEMQKQHVTLLDDLFKAIQTIEKLSEDDLRVELEPVFYEKFLGQEFHCKGKEYRCYMCRFFGWDEEWETTSGEKVPAPVKIYKFSFDLCL